MSAIRPSPALLVPAETPLMECVRKMRDEKVGSILVVAGSKPHSLVGIFTERDLLKWVDEIQAKALWEKPVSLFMSKPVQKLALYEIDDAAAFMLEHRIRHLPIVYEDEEGIEHLAGVVSMRDLFASIAGSQKKSSLLKRSGPARTVGLISNNPGSREWLTKVFGQGGKGKIVTLAMDRLNQDKDLPVSASSFDFIVLDIDESGAQAWLQCLKILLQSKKARSVIVVFDPSLHVPKNVAILNRLSGAEKIATFAKPLNVLEVLNHANFLAASRRSRTD